MSVCIGLRSQQTRSSMYKGSYLKTYEILGCVVIVYRLLRVVVPNDEVAINTSKGRRDGRRLAVANAGDVGLPAP